VLKGWPQKLGFNFDGFVKSPTAALRFIPALLNSRYARRRSRFNRVNHCGVLVSTPHSSRFASLAFGAFYFAVPFLYFYEFINFDSSTPEEKVFGFDIMVCLVL